MSLTSVARNIQETLIPPHRRWHHKRRQLPAEGPQDPAPVQLHNLLHLHWLGQASEETLSEHLAQQTDVVPRREPHSGDEIGPGEGGRVGM